MDGHFKFTSQLYVKRLKVTIPFVFVFSFIVILSPFFFQLETPASSNRPYLYTLTPTEMSRQALYYSTISNVKANIDSI